MGILNLPLGLMAVSLMYSLCTACTHWGGEKLKSDWQALGEADRLKCNDIPLLPDDLRIDRVHVITDTGPSLLLEVTNRRGVRSFYHLPFRAFGDLTSENLVPLPISPESIFLGGGISNGKAVFVLRAMEKSKPVIQVRDLSNNAILNRFPADASAAWDLGAWHLSKGILRALVREIKDDEALDDQNHLQIEVNLAADSKVPIRAVPSRALVGQAELFFDSRSRPHTLWLDRGTSDKVLAQPIYRILPWRADTKDEALILDDKGKIENWAFMEAYDHILVASIKGDSLLWENATIDLQRLSKVAPFNREMQVNLPLSKVHVARPLLAQGPKGEYLFLPQWLDHELTVALFDVKAQEAKPLGFGGIFKEGTSFYDAFYHEPSESYYMISKGPGSSQGRYSLCRLDL